MDGWRGSDSPLCRAPCARPSTGADGGYLFGDLFRGKYIVCKVRRDGRMGEPGLSGWTVIVLSGTTQVGGGRRPTAAVSFTVDAGSYAGPGSA
jgi:hypothetical protein